MLRRERGVEQAGAAQARQRELGEHAGRPDAPSPMLWEALPLPRANRSAAAGDEISNLESSETYIKWSPPDNQPAFAHGTLPSVARQSWRSQDSKVVLTRCQK